MAPMGFVTRFKYYTLDRLKPNPGKEQNTSIKVLEQATCLKNKTAFSVVLVAADEKRKLLSRSLIDLQCTVVVN